MTHEEPLSPGERLTPEEIGALTERLEISRRAIEALEGERTRLERLLCHLPTLVAELDPDRLADGVAEAARSLAGARFAVFVPADGEARYTGCARKEFLEPPALTRAPILAAASASPQTLRIDDLTTWAPGEQTLREYGVLPDGRLVRSWLAAPVQGVGAGREMQGVLYLGHHRAHAFSSRHEELVGSLGRQLGVALEHAALFAERSRVATGLSETLLPPLLPDIPGVDLAARYRATGAGNLVGGDFYDVFETGSHGPPNGAGCWGIVLGDVAGFGPEAAALTGLARYSLRALAQTETRPGALLGLLNETMLDQRVSDRFLTAVYATLVPTGGRPGGSGVSPDRIDVTLASAGHPPVVLLRDDERVELAGVGTGMLLGAFADVTCREERLTLRPGDALVLTTDGVIEARDDTGEEFGVERLAELVGTCAGRSAAGIARRVERAVLDHRGERTDDDVAIMVVRCR